MTAKHPDPFSDFLYPFLEEKSNQGRVSLEAALEEVRGSTLQKAHEVVTMRQAFFDEQGEALIAAAVDMARSFANGGKLLAFGNGGSATDAQDIAADFLNPGDGHRPLPAISLTNDIGVITAVGNDVGFDNVFTRQVIAFGQPGDIALGFSTSGQSPNLIAACEQAKKMKLLTIGIAGYDGGKMSRAGLDHCFIVRSSYVPRIQEVQATIYHTLWELTHHLLRSNDLKSLLHFQEGQDEIR
jgi:D-sedoheptulose 7-phosphate isomerase